MVFRECHFLGAGTEITIDEASEVLRLIETLDQKAGKMPVKVRGTAINLEWSLDDGDKLTIKATKG